MIRIGESRIRPTDAISIASTMNARKLIDSSVFSEVRDSTSSHTTASDGRPAAAFSAARATSEIDVSIISSAIEPWTGTPSSRRSLRMTLVSSRATSQRIRSPGGF
jgi:hypothetical protein